MITCVHIIQLKVLTCIRVGNKQKKIDISIPKLDNFIHKIYINVARKVYKNVYLFEKNISPLLTQKNYRELEQIVQECILSAIRDSIPTEDIIRAYMDESVEEDEQIFIENIPLEDEEEKKNESTKESNNDEIKEPKEEESSTPIVPAIKNIDEENVVTRLTFNNVDTILDDEEKIIKKDDEPKSIERLEELSSSMAIQRKLEEETNIDDDRIKISGDTIDLSGFDILDEEPDSRVNGSSHDFVLDGVEELI